MNMHTSIDLYIYRSMILDLELHRDVDRFVYTYIYTYVYVHRSTDT